MIRLITLIIFANLIFSQYVLGKGLYLSVNGAYNFTNISETEIETDLTQRFSGSGLAYDLGLVFKFDRRNFLSIEFGQRKLDITHRSSLLADSSRIAISSIEQKMQYNTFQIQYLKKFEQNPLFIGGGGGARFPANFSSSDYIQGILEQSYGLGTIGLEFAADRFSLVSYISYAFPLSKLKKNSAFEDQMGELFLGLKLWIKLF
ncbi:MAG: hypothetical protein KDD94_07395 [Calditrichaeota bacterium]|nr:hypothetical protein [Calditrichota bacterium]